MKDREASNKSVGFRLQKMRAISLILDVIKTNPKAFVYSAVEYFEDVYINTSTPEKSSVKTFEEDKHYDPESVFSLNTLVVRKSITSFIDIWFAKGNGVSKNLYFSFYATNQIGKESNTKLVDNLGIKLPKKPLLESLLLESISAEVLDCLKKFIIHQYTQEYEGSEYTHYLEDIKKWTDADWENFLKQIRWSFSQETESDYKNTVLEKIRSCEYFSESMDEGKDEVIFSQLMEEFDERQNLPDPLERFVHRESVQLVFIKAKSQPLVKLETDLVFEMWDKLPQPTDKRSVEEKLSEICPKLTPKAINLLNIKTTRSKVETKKFENLPRYHSFRYRVYEKSETHLLEIFQNFTGKVTENQLLKWLEQIKQQCSKQLSELKIIYHYQPFSDTLIEGIILDLFDNCFLSFDYESAQ